ncbi:SH3 domain-containing protein [Mesobacillus harenae]|uniref:SH3 domain-containing protein n=1 Tax=Mesobacillus harenae TaxID=2213203 RepID=UPI0015812045|nr:SH3 domain-containing protein [Mesobacillus harenae]
MVQKLGIMLICLCMAWSTFLPQESAEASTNTVKITADSLNVRKGPGLSYGVNGQVRKGETYNLVKEDGDWVQISLKNGSKGWVAGWFIKKETTVSSIKPSAKNETATITTNGLRIRKGPGTEFQIVGSLNNGQAVQVLEQNENWTKVRFSAGEGWVSQEYLAFSSPALSGNNIKTTASGSILADNLNVRATASLNGQVIGKLNKGTSVKIITEEKSWTKIEYKGQAAWVSSQYVKKAAASSSSDQAGSSSSSTERTGIVTASSLNVRNSGSLNGKVVGSVTKGQSYKIIEEKNNWVKIEYKPGSFGWAAGWFFDKTNKVPSDHNVSKSTVQILHNGTNIRKGPGVKHQVAKRVNQGANFSITGLKNDWYEIELENGDKGYVAGWIVSVSGAAPQIERPGASLHIKNKTIVIDPGHGGRDSGTIGARGTLEKDLNLRTAKLLYDKLRASGTKVILTRSSDSYLSLKSRVSTSQYNNADAFISIHYDSIFDRSVRGITSYYYYSREKSLAEYVHSSVISQTKLKDRGVRSGNYHVLRENSQKSILLELGYLSNASEEMAISSGNYQEAVTAGIFEGLARYFKSN